MASDPVCEMAVETGDGLHVEHDGGVFWFCSPYCRDEFIADPARFLAGAEAAPTTPTRFSGETPT
jgi:Cu+-exporting ATPase